MPVSSAIVSTVRDAGDVLPSFIRYHRAIGFERIYLIFDDPRDPSFEKLSEEAGVVALRHDDALRRRWSGLRSWERMQPHLDKEVMARQVLNCELAIDMARADGLDWLLHIDSDEAFFCPSGQVSDVFSRAHPTPLHSICFMNFEALPEKTDITDYFRDVSLFKVNLMHMGKPRFGSQQQKLIRQSWFTGGELLNFNL